MSELLDTRPKNRNRLAAAVATSALLLSSTGCEVLKNKDDTTELQLNDEQRQAIDRKAAQNVISIAHDIWTVEWDLREMEQQKGPIYYEDLGELPFVTKNTIFISGSMNGYTDKDVSRNVTGDGAVEVVTRQSDGSSISSVTLENTSEQLDNLTMPSLSSFVEDDDTHVVKVSCINPTREVTIDGSVLSAWYNNDQNERVEVPEDELIDFTIDTIDGASTPDCG